MTQVRSRAETFDVIYATDLVYEASCWQLCGDAHCCHFSRYRLDASGQHELPLLPGEYDYMAERGMLASYRDLERVTFDVKLDRATLRYDTLVFAAGAGCSCRHEVRPTVCRLYPLLPVFTTEGRVVGIDSSFGIPEELEALAGAPRACRLSRLSFEQLDNFLKISDAIARDPVCMFHVMAYKLAKDHVVARLRAEGAKLAARPDAIAKKWQEVGRALAVGNAFERDTLMQALDALANELQQRFGVVLDEA